MSNIFTSCLICGSEKIKDIQGYEKSFLSSCRNCGFVFCKKMPTDEELTECYKGYSREEYISPITVSRYNDLLDQFEKYRKTNNIIDVGAGNGFFLLEAKKRGWNVYGTEFESRAVEYCIQKGIIMHSGKLSFENYSPNHFDVITSFEVIEHINNPLEEVNNFKKMLRKDGILYLTTPNFNSISRLYLKGKWTIIHYPEHLSYYTSATLKKLFESKGFMTSSIRTSNIQFSRLNIGVTAGRETIGNAIKEEDIRIQVEKKWFLKIAKKAINLILRISKKGDTLKAVFTNPGS